MGMNGDTALVLAKNYVKKTLQGQGALKGQDGFSPIIEENADNTDKVYKLDITTADSAFTTPNLKGADGQGGTGGSGEENIIDSISVNGVNVTPDENKNVDIEVPIEKIKVNGELQTPVNKVVDITIPDAYDDTDIRTELANKADTTAIPSKVSELTNDSNYQTAEQVNSTVTTEIAKVVADAPEDLNTLKEMSDWIAGHENDASAMNSAISDNKTAITALQTGKADKSEIPTTLPANGGNSDTVNNHTVKSDVPENAVFTDTIYDDTEVKESIEELSSNLVEQKMLGWTVPSECPIQNYTDSDGVFHQRVGRVDMGSLNWAYWNEPTHETFSVQIADIKKAVDNGVAGNLLCSVYTNTDANGTYFHRNDKTISVDTNQYVNVYDTEYTDADTFKKAMKGIYLYYELATPITKTIDGNEAVEELSESLSVIGKCKNLLNPTIDTDTHNGVTFTRNDDGTYSLSGGCTDTSNASYVSIIENLPLEIGKYKITGALNENNYIRCIIKVSNNTNKNIYDYGKGVVLDVSEANTTITLLIASTDDTSQTRIIKPMLTTNLSATFDDFVPYTGDGETLTHDVAELKKDLGGLTFSASGTALSITDGTNTWTLEAN